MTDLSNSSLIFYDGVCGFCNHSVNWILQRDKSGRFLLAPLQGSTARQLLAPELRQTLSSVVLRHNGHLYTHSAAVCRILFLLGGFWWVCGALLWIIPSPCVISAIAASPKSAIDCSAKWMPAACPLPTNVLVSLTEFRRPQTG